MITICSMFYWCLQLTSKIPLFPSIVKVDHKVLVAVIDGVSVVHNQWYFSSCSSSRWHGCSGYLNVTVEPNLQKNEVEIKTLRKIFSFQNIYM